MINRRTALIAAGAGLATSACTTKSLADAQADRKSAFHGFAVNLESWWRDIPFEARFDKAAQAEFSHVEFWSIDGAGRDAKTLEKLARDAGINVAQIVGDSPALARRDVRTEFLDNCQRAIENAQILGTDIVTLTGHQDVDGIETIDALRSYQDHMAAAAEIFNSAKVYAAIEPFNPYNHPGHFINGYKEALRMCEEIDAPYMKINWDLFHMQRHEGNLIDNLRKGQDHICYMQLADSPDRHQPGTGEINYTEVIKACREVGYDRPIGLELWAKNDDYDQALTDIYNLALTL